MHRNEDQILALNDNTPLRNKKCLTMLRLKGMYKANLEKIANGVDDLHVEQRSSKANEVIMCNSCNSFVSKRYLFAHRCPFNTKRNVGISLFESANTCYDIDVLHRYRSDNIGKLCANNEYLKIIGRESYSETKVKKRKDITRRTTMNTNRSIARLYIEMMKFEETKDFSIINIFDRTKFHSLELAIEEMSGDSTTEKRGKSDVGYDIKFAAKALKKYFLTKDEAISETITKFIEYFNNCWENLFDKSNQTSKALREIQVSDAAEMFFNSEVKRLNDYINDALNKFRNETVILDKNSFLLLRRLIASKLTLFNGKRGRDPGSLTLSSYGDAEHNVGIDKLALGNISDYKDITLISMFKVAFEFGMENSSKIDILIPAEDCQLIQMLACANNRRNSGVHSQNKYVLASTEQSLEQLACYDDVIYICTSADISLELMNKRNRFKLCAAFGTCFRDDHHIEYACGIRRKRQKYHSIVDSVIEIGEFLMGETSSFRKYICIIDAIMLLLHSFFHPQRATVILEIIEIY